MLDASGIRLREIEFSAIYAPVTVPLPKASEDFVLSAKISAVKSFWPPTVAAVVSVLIRSKKNRSIIFTLVPVSCPSVQLDAT